MNRDQKAAVIEEIAADISEAQAIFAVDYRGITVAQAEALRTRLREADASFRVVKNSLTERAADQAGADQLKPLLEGPTALTFARGDAAAAARAVAEFARATQLLGFKGGVMDGAALSSAEVGAISRLPSREVLYGQLVGLVANPLSGLARSLNALIGGLAIGLGGVLSKKESGEIPGGEAPALDQEEPAAEESVAEASAAEEPVATEQEAEAGEQEEPAAEAAAPEEPIAVEQDEPAKESGEAPAEATEPEAAAAAEAETDDGSAPEAPSGDDEKEDQ